MHKGSLALVAFCLFAPVLESQVLAPAEILEPGIRALQQKHLPELEAAALDIVSHKYPYRFYLSRTLDLTERQEQLTDQRSIRFADFKGRTVLQVTGNYFAAYTDRYMDRNERVKRTFLDVMLPILRATAPRLQNETQLTAFALEISQHVRKQVMGVTMERPENLALIIPRDVAAKIVLTNDVNDEIDALRESTVIVDGNQVALWPGQSGDAPEIPQPHPPSKLFVSKIRAGQPELAAPVIPQPVEPPIALSAPPRDLSPEALQKQQVPQQELFDRISHELESQAHFVSYAPPALIAFHHASYLQLSITTNLSPADTGSQYRLAALSFDRHVSHLVRPLLAFIKQDQDFDGVVFSATIRVPGKTADSALTQSVEFFFPVKELRRYEQYDITGQQLIDSGFVLINGERVTLQLQSAEADIR